MRRMIFGAAFLVTMTAASHAQVANSTPLTFGMTTDAAAQALGTQLIYVQGRPGNEMYLALPNVKGSALSDRRDGLYLQFRRGKLEGWKGDWGTNRPCCN
jgi:spore coat protein U-like protein